MAESAYTPGPYLRDGLTVYALDERKNANRFSALVQEGYIHHTRHEKQRTPQEELEATAQLFAAAPDMYEALKAALPVLEAMQRLMAGHAAAAGMGGDGPLLDSVRAALRRALGKEG